MADSFRIGHLVITGLGLIGGSFAKAVRQARLADTITAYDQNGATLSIALAEGVIDRSTATLHAAVAEADVIVLATPVRSIITLLDEIAPALLSSAKVLDLGSTKREIVAAMNRLPVSVDAVGGHPMAGKAGGGWPASDSTLFHNAPFALCPTERTPIEAGGWAESIVRAIGATPLWMDAATHDEAVARISHLPYVLSATLVRTATPTGIAQQLAAGSYRDTSRVAAHDPRMFGDILLTNRDNVLALMRQARAILGELEESLESGNEAAVRAWIAQITLSDDSR